MTIRLRSSIASVGLALSLSLSVVPAFAVDGTSGSTPTPNVTCALHPAAPISSFGATPAVATPIASPVIATPVVATPMASPVSPVVATPIAENDEVEASPLDKDLAAAATSILDCMSENNADVLTGITSADFRGSWLGLGGPINNEDLAALLPLMPQLPYDLVSVQNSTSNSDTATTEITYTAGNHLITATWDFTRVKVDGSEVWRVDAEEIVPTAAPEGAATVKVTLADGSITFKPATVTGENVVLEVTNTGKQPHEILILRVPNGMDVGEILAAPTGIPADATFIAQSSVPAGESGTVVLTGLRPGTYTVLDLLPDDTGMPNAAGGMVTTFKVGE
ncbi:MAG: hypothetical protein KC435_11055 [Thermomicrobiales bacterium]|nr:hypothetical protein [Thermomicrobiales bacterium]